MLRARRRDGAPRRAAEVARHLRLARRDDLAVAELASAAADARAVAALDAAAGYLEEAIALAPEDPDLLMELGEVEAWRGRHAAAVETLDRGVNANAGRDRAELAAAHARAGRCFQGALCDPSRSLACYRAAIEILGAMAAPPARLLAETLCGAAWCEAVAGDVEEAEALLAEVHRTGPPAADDHLLANQIGSARGHIMIRRGRFTDSYAAFLAGGEAAIRAGRPDRAYDSWTNGAGAAVTAGEPERALEFARRAHAALRQAGLARIELHVLAALAHVLLRLGRVDEARVAARDERELADRLSDPALRAIADHDTGLLAVELGDDAEGEALLAAALRAGAKVSRPRARLARAEALARLGRHAEADEELRATVLEPVGPADFPDTLVARLSRVQGIVAAGRGDRELAERRFDEAIGLWRTRTREAGVGDAYLANLVDFGRPPVIGLIEPARELERAIADRESLLSAAS
jgi:tetratricopeptide (TPR) repeat protein